MGRTKKARRLRESADLAVASGAAGEGASSQPGVAARRALLGVAIVALAAGGAMRVWAACGDLWFDEVWSLAVAEQTARLVDIFTLHFDNNHYLVTLWMKLWGSRAPWFVYRIPSLIAGLGTILLAGRFARRWGFVAAQAAIVLTSASYVLIVYASEARGYALAGFFALAALLALDQYLEHLKPAAALVFALAVVFGFLSHLTFASFYLGAAIWSMVRALRRGPRVWDALVALAWCHLLPLGFLAALYLADLRSTILGGGPPYSLADVVAETLALAIGGVSANMLFALTAVTAAVVALVLLWRAGCDLWVFFAVAIFGAPMLLLVVRRPEYLHVRYFYVNIVLFLVLCSYLLGRIDRLGRGGRLAFAAVIALFIAGNASSLYDFARFGRGQYLAAAQHMNAKSAEDVLTVEGDHDFRNELLLAYYADYLPPGRRIEYHPQSAHDPKAPQWFVLHSQEAHYVPPRAFTDRRNVQYVLSGTFPYAGLSGFHWAVYQRANAPPRATR